jgi:hypothetical protein
MAKFNRSQIPRRSTQRESGRNAKSPCCRRSQSDRRTMERFAALLRMGFTNVARWFGSSRTSGWLRSQKHELRFLCQIGCSAITYFASRSVIRIEIVMSFYDRDSTVPFWRSNVDVDALFENHSHRPDRAQAWLRYRDISEPTAVTMRGHFEGGILGSHTYHWTFTPTHTGELAIVMPVYERGRLVDLLAIARNDHSIWGCVTGAGQYVGSTARHRQTTNSPLRVYKTPINWLLANCDGILPLVKAFFPMLQHAARIIAEGYEHACEIEELTFMAPAERFFLHCDAAEQAALNRIGFEVEA